MKSSSLWTLCIALLHQSASAQYFRSKFQTAPAIVHSSAELRAVNLVDTASNHSEQEGLDSSEQFGNVSSWQADSFNTTVSVGDSTADSFTENGTDTISTHSLVTVTILDNSSASSSSSTTIGGKMSANPLTPEIGAVNGSTAEDDDEVEEVVRGKPSRTQSVNSTTVPPDTLYQKTLALINDTYTLSILLPVGAGIVFASTIIVTVAACRCLSRKCRRRRLRKKVLPDSVKNFRPSDKARLLTESSDEEF